MTSKHLDLKLTDEEIEQVTAPYSNPHHMGRAIADTATVKATWAIWDWLSNKDSAVRFQPAIDAASDLGRILEADGIQKPEAKTI